MPIKPEQFAVLIKLMRGSLEHPACLAAYRVLVEGASQAAAAREAGITPGGVSNAVKRYRNADSMVRAAYSRPEDV
jgi:hypothetical protein